MSFVKCEPLSLLNNPIKPFNPRQKASWMTHQDHRMSSASVALVTDDDRVLVLKASYKDYWSFPGGMIDAGETPRQAAIRELREEAGITLDESALQFAFVASRRSKQAMSYTFMFEATVDAAVLDLVVVDGHETIDHAIVTRQSMIDRERNYSQSTRRWAEGLTGYDEQLFNSGKST
jgi:8-oxo-dGTP diphosphatase